MQNKLILILSSIPVVRRGHLPSFVELFKSRTENKVTLSNNTEYGDVVIVDIWRNKDLLFVLKALKVNSRSEVYISIRSVNKFRRLNLFLIDFYCRLILKKSISYYTDSALIKDAFPSLSVELFLSFVDLPIGHKRADVNSNDIYIHTWAFDVTESENEKIDTIIDKLKPEMVLARNKSISNQMVLVNNEYIDNFCDFLSRFSSIICITPPETHNIGTSNVFVQALLLGMNIYALPNAWITNFLTVNQVQFNVFGDFLQVNKLSHTKIEAISLMISNSCDDFINKISN